MGDLIRSIVQADQQLFLTLNGAHTPWLDPVMQFFSNIPVWIPLYAFIVFLFFYKRPWRIGVVALCCVGLTFLFTDQISASLIKEWVARVRPSHVEAWRDIIHLLEGEGGLYGFVSSHAANVFGLACFSSLVIRRKWLTIFLYVWAALVSYSRIYVGKHFPADVLCGALLGWLTGWLMYKLYRFIRHEFLSGYATDY